MQNPQRETAEEGAILFYFDFASPYAYLASTQMDGLAERTGRRVVWRPMMLGAAMKLTGAQPLVLMPMRGDYARHDLKRFAAFLGVPFEMPPRMPIRSLAPARAFYWLRDRDGGKAVELAKALFVAHFGRGEDIEPAAKVAEIARSLGIDDAALLAGIEDPAIKETLKRETDGAIGRGVFGAPFFLVDGEPFWGADRLPHLERWLLEG